MSSELHHLIITTTADRELKHHSLACQLPVHFPVRVKSEVDTTPLLLIQDNLANFAAVLACANPFPNNLHGVNDIMKECVVYGGQCTAVRALLSL